MPGAGRCVALSKRMKAFMTGDCYTGRSLTTLENLMIISLIRTLIFLFTWLKAIFRFLATALKTAGLQGWSQLKPLDLYCVESSQMIFSSSTFTWFIKNMQRTSSLFVKFHSLKKKESWFTHPVSDISLTSSPIVLLKILEHRQCDTNF